LPGFPVAATPLWQLAQVPVTLEWSKWVGTHARVEWQSSQGAVVWMWVGVLPGAVVPLWQLAQVPVTAK
jgi:hypothetical protein